MYWCWSVVMLVWWVGVNNEFGRVYFVGRKGGDDRIDNWLCYW